MAALAELKAPARAPAWGGQGCGDRVISTQEGVPPISDQNILGAEAENGFARRATESGHNGQMMLEVACEAPGAVGNNRQAREMGVARASGVGRREGESRLRGLAGKLRHRIADVRARAISNLNGKFALGLLSARELESEPSIFSDIVTLLQELLPGERSSECGGQRPSLAFSIEGPGTGASVYGGELLSLCGQIAKDPSNRARLVGQGAAEPLSRIANHAGTGGQVAHLAESAAQILVMLPDSPGAFETNASNAGGTDSLIPHQSQTSQEGPPAPGTAHGIGISTAALATFRVDVDRADEHTVMTEQQQQDEESRVLYGDGSNPRWPRWTKELIDGPSLSSDNFSVTKLVRCLKAGWRFPPVRLVRSEEAALFDFEVRFRTESRETRLLGCIRYLRDEILEDYPAELLLQRHGSIGRLASLLRAPSASEKVLEEALSAAKRLLERLVTSARLHQDSAFLSPSPTADTNRGIGASTGDASSGRQHDIGSSEPSSRTRKFLRNAGQPLSRPYSPDFTPDCPGSKISVPDFLPNGASPDGVCVTPGEAATATLLSFRYPREPLFTSPSDGVGVWGVAVAAAGGRARQLADCHDDDDARASEDLGGEGISVCGALFALFLSVCPLLGYQDGTGLTRGGRGIDGRGGVGAKRGWVGEGRCSGRRAGPCLAATMGLLGGGDDDDVGGGQASRVAVAAGELLQAVTPFLLEPPPALSNRPHAGHPEHNNNDLEKEAFLDGGHEEKISWRGHDEYRPGLSCPLDAVRFQELLSSMGRVLADNGLDRYDAIGDGGGVNGCDRIAANGASGRSDGVSGEGGDKSGIATGGVGEVEGNMGGSAPSPLASVLLDLLLLLRPSDFADDTATQAAIKPPASIASLLRSLVWDPTVAERAPWIRKRLRPYLGAVDSEGERLLEHAQTLTKEAASVLDYDGGGYEQGPTDTWGWAAFQLEKIRRSLPLLREVNEPRIIEAALVLWASAVTTIAPLEGNKFHRHDGVGRDASADGYDNSLMAAATAERVGAGILRELVEGLYGVQTCASLFREKACRRALETLEELAGVEKMIEGGRLPIVPGLASAMSRRGLRDPRLRPSNAEMAAVALALTLKGQTDGGAVHNSVSASGFSGREYATMSYPNDFRQEEQHVPLVVTLMHRATASRYHHHHHLLSPQEASSSRQSQNGVGSDALSGRTADSSAAAASAAAAAARLVERSCSVLHDWLRSGPSRPRRSPPDSEAGLDGLRIGQPESRTGPGVKSVSNGGIARADTSRAKALAPTLEAFFLGSLECGKAEGLDSRRTGPYKAVATLIDFLDATDNPDPSGGDLLAGRFDGRGPTEQERIKDQASRTASGAGVTATIWTEVRGLCRAHTKDRETASRRLWGLLRDCQGSPSVPNRATASLVFSPDPVSFCVGSTDDGITAATPDVTTEIAKISSVRRLPNLGGSGLLPPAFTPDHVRNLADVAGSRTLETGLRTAAAEQLCSVLLAPGVASAVLRNDDRHVSRNDDRSLLRNGPSGGNGEQFLCTRILRAASSGILPWPPVPQSGLPDYQQSSSPWRSTRAPSLVAKKAEEAFLGLLWAAVWKLPPVRRMLTAPNVAAVRSFGAEVETPEHVESESGVVEAGATVAAVCSRLYDTRPSVRRLASRVVIRLAFDGPSCFLALCSGSSSRPGVMPWTRDHRQQQQQQHALRAFGNDNDNQTNDPDHNHHEIVRVYSHPDVFAVSSMVVRAYPQLLRWNDGQQHLDRPAEHADSAASRRDDEAARPADNIPAFATPAAVTPRTFQIGSNRSVDVSLEAPRLTVLSPFVVRETSGCIYSDSPTTADDKEGDTTVSRSSRRDDCVRKLAAGEWRLLPSREEAARSTTNQMTESGSRDGTIRVGRVHPRAAPERVAHRLAGELMSATRRSEFGDAMMKTRAWILAGRGYLAALFGQRGTWENAFARFLRTPPTSVKDRIALRDVAALLKEGTRFMCTRGLQALADASETCFVPVLADDWRPPSVVAGQLYGDWHAATSRRDTPRELEAKEALRLSVLDLLVAVVTSAGMKAPAWDGVAKTMATSQLIPIIAGEFLERQGGSRREYHEGSGGGRSQRARRLSIELIVGLVKRCGPEAIQTWSGVRVRGLGDDILAFAASGAGAGHGCTTVLAKMVQSMARNVSSHRAPDGFKGRGVLTASLLGLKVILSDVESRSTVPWIGDNAYRHVAGLLHLACHRDAAIRALSLSVITGFHSVSSGDSLSGAGRQVDGSSSACAQRQEEETVQACLRTAQDAFHETPAVRAEALRFLSRHVADWPTRQGAGCLPEYALHLAFSLAEAVPPLLSSTLPGGNTHGATGPLLVAACMLRFVSVAATAVFDEPTRVPPRVHGAALVAEGGDGTGAAELLVGELWASGCLEACVYVLGVVPLRGTPPDSAEGSGNSGWGALFQTASGTLQTSALRRAQATSLALLRTVTSSADSPWLATKPSPDAGLADGAGSSASLRRDFFALRELRHALLRKTPLLVGVVRCMIRVVDEGVSVVTGRPDEDHARVAREACSLLACLLTTSNARATEEHHHRSASSSSTHIKGDDGNPGEGIPKTSVFQGRKNTTVGENYGFSLDVESMDFRGSDHLLLSPGAAVPGAAFAALDGILRWRSEAEDAGIVFQAQTEGMRLLLAMLSIPEWRRSLDFDSTEALSVTRILLREEVAALVDRPKQPWVQRRARRASDELRARCLACLLESSDGLREVALEEGLMGELAVCLESLLVEMATVGYGRDTLESATKHLETLRGVSKKKETISTLNSKRRRGSASIAISESGDAQDMPTTNDNNDKLAGNNTRGGSNTTSSTAASRSRQRKPLRESLSSPPNSNGVEEAAGAPTNSGKKDLDEPRTEWPSSRGTAATAAAASLQISGRPSSRTTSDAKIRGGAGEGPSGAVLEEEFQMAAALMMAGMGNCRRAQAECLRFGLPQLLWKAWPVALASELSHNSSGNSSRRRCRSLGTGSGAEGVEVTVVKGGSLLLRAVLGLACALAREFHEGKRAFVFAGPEASHGPIEAAGEWPKSSRSLLHRVAALALSHSLFSTTEAEGGGGSGSGAARRAHGRGPSVSGSAYGNNPASEMACDVIRSCCLLHECRAVLTQSGFFGELVAQLRHLYGKGGTKAGTPSFVKTVRRTGDLLGILVNATLTTDGQKVILQVHGIGDMLGDAVDVCLRITEGLLQRSSRDSNRPPQGAGTILIAPTQTTKSAFISAVNRTLLLLRNLALAPSTGQVAAHRDPLLDLILRTLSRQDHPHAEDFPLIAGTSCLRAIIRGGSSDGGRKTAVGAGGRTAEVRRAVDSAVAVYALRSDVAAGGQVEEGRAAGDHDARLHWELLAVQALL